MDVLYALHMYILLYNDLNSLLLSFLLALISRSYENHKNNLKQSMQIDLICLYFPNITRGKYVLTTF